MAFPTTERIKGRQVVPTAGGERTNWKDITLDITYEVENPQSASATFKEKVLDISDAKATISGYLGASNNTANLPQPGDEITDLSFAIADTEMIPAGLLDAAQAGKWRVVSTNYKSSKDSAEWTMNIEAGFID